MLKLLFRFWHSVVDWLHLRLGISPLKQQSNTIETTSNISETRSIESGNTFMRTQHIILKEGVDCDDILYMHPHLLSILTTINLYCYHHNIDLVITSAYRSLAENKAVGAKTLVHTEDRAFDVSIRGDLNWNENHIRNVIQLVEEKHMDIGAISSASGESRPILRHRGTADHLHIQVRKGL